MKQLFPQDLNSLCACVRRCAHKIHPREAAHLVTEILCCWKFGSCTASLQLVHNATHVTSAVPHKRMSRVTSLDIICHHHQSPPTNHQLVTSDHHQLHHSGCFRSPLSPRPAITNHHQPSLITNLHWPPTIITQSSTLSLITNYHHQSPPITTTSRD